MLNTYEIRGWTLPSSISGSYIVNGDDNSYFEVIEVRTMRTVARVMKRESLEAVLRLLAL